MKVTVTLKSGDGLPPRIVTGTVLQVGERAPEQGGFPAPRYGSWPQAAPESACFAVRQENGKVITFRNDQIASIESEGISATLRKEKRMLLVDRKGAAGNPFYITYLSPGLTWAPAYRIALGKESKLQLDQSATVINELEDLKDAELSFVSGFPNLEYIGVTSPLASGMTLQAFLQQLNANENGGTGAVMPRAMAQAAMNFKMEADSAVSPLPGTG